MQSYQTYLNPILRFHGQVFSSWKNQQCTGLCARAFRMLLLIRVTLWRIKEVCLTVRRDEGIILSPFLHN